MSPVIPVHWQGIQNHPSTFSLFKIVLLFKMVQRSSQNCSADGHKKSTYNEQINGRTIGQPFLKVQGHFRKKKSRRTTLNFEQKGRGLMPSRENWQLRINPLYSLKYIPNSNHGILHKDHTKNQVCSTGEELCLHSMVGTVSLSFQRCRTIASSEFETLGKLQPKFLETRNMYIRVQTRLPHRKQTESLRTAQTHIKSYTLNRPTHGNSISRLQCPS